MTCGVDQSQLDKLNHFIGDLQISNDSDCWKWNIDVTEDFNMCTTR